MASRWLISGGALNHRCTLAFMNSGARIMKIPWCRGGGGCEWKTNTVQRRRVPPWNIHSSLSWAAHAEGNPFLAAQFITFSRWWNRFPVEMNFVLSPRSPVASGSLPGTFNYRPAPASGPFPTRTRCFPLEDKRALRPSPGAPMLDVIDGITPCRV